MMMRGVAGWWGYRLGESGRLAEGEVEAALDCSLEEEAVVEEVEAPPSPPWCHLQRCGRGCCYAPPITESPEQRGRSCVSPSSGKALGGFKTCVTGF